jgi:hypothetical protein
MEEEAVSPCNICMNLHKASGSTAPADGLVLVGLYPPTPTNDGLQPVEFYTCLYCTARLIRAPIGYWQVLDIEEH